MTPKTSIGPDTVIDVGKNSRRFVSNEQIPLPVRNHIGRTTAETRQQLELKSAAHVFFFFFFFFFPYGTKFKIEYCRTGACGFGDLQAINKNIYIYIYIIGPYTVYLTEH